MKNAKTKKHNELNYYLIPKKGSKFILPTIGLLLALSVAGAYYVGDTLTNRVEAYFSPDPIIIPEPTSPREIICKATNGENCDVIYNLCTKESGKFINTDPNDTEKCQKWAVNAKNTNGTTDFSWLQVNDVHIIGRPASKGKGTISMECVYDLPCVAKWANEQIKKGNGHIWSTWDQI